MALCLSELQFWMDCMTDVRIRNVDAWVLDSLRFRAREHGNSLEGELRELLRKEAMRPKEELAEELRRMRDELREKYGIFSDSTPVIREMRDERG
jgi:plasmid stability protein